VRPDGVARVTDQDKSARVRLSPEELTALQQARTAVDFERLSSTFGSEPPPLDAYETTLSADGRTVKILHDAEVPLELERLRSTCAALIERYRPR
jgi:hypothetical protein